MAIDLKLRDPAGLAQFDTAVATRGHYLTGAQFAARFGPGAADVSSVSLTAAGLEVTAVSGNSQVVDATGTAGALTALFHTTLSTYENGSRTFFANDDPVVIPAALAPVIEGVVGLDNRAVMTPAGTRPTAQATTRPVGGLSPSRVNSAYRFGQLGATGSGVTVVLWEFDGHKVDRAGYDAAPSSGEFEVEEDSEIVSAIAPAATVISISWGECEAQPSASYLTAINNAFSQAAAEGIGIYSASGDRGSRDCAATPTTPAVDFPGSSVYDTSVGGTKLTLGTGVVYGSETAWANGGGGASAVFAKPGWQTAGASTMRMVPDVSAVADPASSYSAYIQGAWTQAGGTSAAAPAWAAFTALYNQKAETAGKADLGFANPALYQVAGSAKYAAVLHDVTTGSNGDYTATTGYDETTGLGSPIGDGLAAVLGVGANVVTVTSAGNQSTAVGTAVNLAVQAATRARSPAGRPRSATPRSRSPRPTTPRSRAA